MKTGFVLSILLVSITFLNAIAEGEDCSLTVEKCFKQVKNSGTAFEDCLLKAKKCEATSALLLETPKAATIEGKFQATNVFSLEKAKKGMLFTVSFSEEAKALLEKNREYAKLIQAETVEFVLAKKGEKSQVIKASIIDVEKLFFASTFKPQRLQEGNFELTASLFLFNSETKKREKVEVTKPAIFTVKIFKEKIVFDSVNNEYFLPIQGVENIEVKPIAIAGTPALNLQTPDGKSCINAKKTPEGVKLTYDALCSVCGKNFEYVITGRERKSGAVEISCFADEILFTEGKKLGEKNRIYAALRKYSEEKASERKTTKYIEADNIETAKSFGFKQYEKPVIQGKNSREKFLFSVGCDKPIVEIPLGLEGVKLVVQGVCNDGLDEIQASVKGGDGRTSLIAAKNNGGKSGFIGKPFDAIFSIRDLLGRVKTFILEGKIGEKADFQLTEANLSESEKTKAARQASAVKLREIAGQVIQKTKAESLLIVGSEEAIPSFYTRIIEIKEGFFDEVKFSSEDRGNDQCYATRFKDCRIEGVKVSRIKGKTLELAKNIEKRG